MLRHLVPYVNKNKNFSLLELSSWSLTMPVVTCSRVNTCHGEVKKERNQGRILAAPSVRQNTDIRVMHERQVVKKS